MFEFGPFFRCMIHCWWLRRGTLLPCSVSSDQTVLAYRDSAALGRLAVSRSGERAGRVGVAGGGPASGDTEPYIPRPEGGVAGHWRDCYVWRPTLRI